MNRFFTKQQKQLLFVAANGKCQICGEDLERGWHADHILPYSKQGETILGNGQATCPKCNLRKSNKIFSINKNVDLTNMIKLRPHQDEGLKKVIVKVQNGEKTVSFIWYPGSGKTLGSLLVGIYLYKMGIIDAMIVFVPRLPLCDQYENDCNRDAPLVYGYFDDTMPSQKHLKFGSVLQFTGDYPIINPKKNNQTGVVMTYASAIRNQAGLIQLFKNKKVLLVADECQMLGKDSEGEDATRAHDVITTLCDMSAFNLIMTGTEERADGKFILPDHIQYKQDENGKFFMDADSYSTYLDGIAGGFLRPFDAEIVKSSIKVKKDLFSETVLRSEECKTVTRFLRRPEIWQPMIDSGVHKHRAMRKQIDQRLCSLISALSIEDANKYKSYLSKNYPDLKVLIATSDMGEKARKNLIQFKKGKHDILITIGMAHVGYDYKPIMNIVCLSNYRTDAYLVQLFLRGGRVMKSIELKEQVLRLTVPDDPYMVDLIERMRVDAKNGIELRDKEEREKQERQENENPILDPEIVTDAWIDGSVGKGMNEGEDINDGEEFSKISTALSRLYPSMPPSKFKAVMNEVGASSGDAKNNQAQQGTKLYKDQQKELKRILTQQAIQRDEIVYNSTGEGGRKTHRDLIRVFGEGSAGFKLSLEELQKRIDWIKQNTPNIKTAI